MASRHCPFETIESAQEYLALLDDVVDETRATAIDDAACVSDAEKRRLDAFRLLIYKLGQLQHHIRGSRRILNDLRTLRRVMLGESGSSPRSAVSARAQVSASSRTLAS